MSIVLRVISRPQQQANEASVNVAGQQHNAISLPQLLGGDHNDTSKQARRIPKVPVKGGPSPYPA